MAYRNIVIDGKDDGFLRKKSRDVEVFDEKLWKLLDDMKETMEKAGGVGIAAPQVGILRKAVIVEVEDEDFFLEMVNPTIVKQEGEQNENYEQRNVQPHQLVEWVAWNEVRTCALQDD